MHIYIYTHIPICTSFVLIDILLVGCFWYAVETERCSGIQIFSCTLPMISYVTDDRYPLKCGRIDQALILLRVHIMHILYININRGSTQLVIFK